MEPSGDERPRGGATGRERRLAEYLAGLDRGEIVVGRIVQVRSANEVRVALGPGVLTARAVGGRPAVGDCRLEVLTPGARPVLRLAVPGPAGAVEMVVDASCEKRAARARSRLDRRA